MKISEALIKEVFKMRFVYATVCLINKVPFTLTKFTHGK